MGKFISFIRKKRYIIIVILAIFAGLLLFVKDNIHLLKLDKSDRGELTYDLGGAEFYGFEYTEEGLRLLDNVNFEMTNGAERAALIDSMIDTLEQPGGYIEEYPSITLSGDYRYVQKLKYEYTSAGRVESVIFAIDSSSGKPEVIAAAQDNNNQFTDASIHALKCNADKLVIVFMVANDFTIQSVAVDNAITFNWIRMFFAVAFVLCLGLIFTSVNWIATRLENVFAILALLIGMTFIFAIPVQKTGWDESFHFREAYTLFGKSDVGTSVLTYMDDTKVWPLNQPQTYEEYKTQNEYVDKLAVGDEDIKSSISLSNIVGYLAPAVGLAIGKLLHLPFTVVFKLGKVCSLLLYIVIVYFAIKRMTSGKRLLTVLALLPTPMYMTSIYNRDNIMLACSFLATSYLFSLFYEEDSRMDWKSFGVISGALFVICLLKAVYAPMLFALCLLPKDKFESRKQRMSMIVAVCLVCLLLVVVLMLPRFIGSDAGSGDDRGLALAGEGAVINLVSQLKYILSNIFGYAKLLLSTIEITFMDYTLGNEVWATLGHYSILAPYSDKLPIFLVFLILTDTVKRDRDMTIVQRLGIFALLAISVALTWTSMYLAFTPVGSGSIQGVQARYYLPVLLPFFMLFNTKKIKVDFNDTIYTKLVLAVPVVLCFLSIYKAILAPYCM